MGRLMLQIDKYDPSTQDLFLYEDYTVTWSNPSPGSVAVKKAYAWNPDCVLYGYRKSLEGISVPYRNFSTYALYGITGVDGVCAAAVEIVNPVANPVNRPIWYNSFPPLFRFTTKRLTHWCAHAFNLGNRDLGATMADMYAANGYLDKMLQPRFIAHNNVECVLSKTDIELPYVYDQAYGTNFQASGPYMLDLAIAESTVEFPLNPVTSVDIGSGPDKTWYYLNAGNLTVQKAYVRSTQSNHAGFAQNRQGTFMLQDQDYDSVFLHDSGSLFLREVRSPTSPEAGDGIMGVALGHVQYPFPTRDWNSAWKTGDPPHKSSTQTSPFVQTQPVVTQYPGDNWDALRTYWTTRSLEFPRLVKVQPQASYAPADPAATEQLALNSATLRTHFS